MYSMALRPGTIEICTDREFLMLALERIVADQFRCEWCPPERLIPLNRGREAEWPVAILIDRPRGLREPLRAFTQSPGNVPVVVWQRSTASEPSLNALDS